MAEIQSSTRQKVIENYIKSVYADNTSRGGNLSDVVFRT